MAQYPTTDQQRFQKQLEVSEGVGNYYVSLLGLRKYETVDLVRQVQSGMAYAAYERFMENSTLSQESILAMLQLPLRTLQRRKREGMLHSDESDRLLRAARVFAKAVALFEGDFHEASVWFTEKLPALGGLTPLELASTELGALEVEHVIHNLEHGIPL